MDDVEFLVMDGNLVNIFLWKKPIKSSIALILLNFAFWLAIGERPLFILSILVLVKVVLSVWRKKIRPEVLVDPPDSEVWTTIETYDMEHRIIQSTQETLSSITSLRQRNHLTFSLLSMVFFFGIGKLGTMIYLRTLILIIGNGAFLVGPFLSIMNINPHIPPGIEFYPDEKTMPGIYSPPHEPEYLENGGSSGPESLTPHVAGMPDHNSRDSEEEFHFDLNHFDSSSSASSTTSNSFEIIH